LSSLERVASELVRGGLDGSLCETQVGWQFKGKRLWRGVSSRGVERRKRQTWQCKTAVEKQTKRFVKVAIHCSVMQNFVA